jgi:hypothetical protein
MRRAVLFCAGTTLQVQKRYGQEVKVVTKVSKGRLIREILTYLSGSEKDVRSYVRSRYA